MKAHHTMTTAESAVKALDHQLGVDRPLLVQYWAWVTGLLHGNLGTSTQFREPVAPFIRSALLNSIKLAALAFIIVSFSAMITPWRRPQLHAQGPGWARATFIGLPVITWVAAISALSWIFVIFVAFHTGFGGKNAVFVTFTELPKDVKPGDNLDLYVQLAGYADRVLRGAKPGDLPVVQPTRFELVLNAKTAKLLDLAIPPTITVRAARLIE